MARAGGRSPRPRLEPDALRQGALAAPGSRPVRPRRDRALAVDYLHVTRAADRLGRRHRPLSHPRLLHGRSTPTSSDVCREAAMQDEGRYAVPILTVTAGMASLAAIVVLAASDDQRHESQPPHPRAAVSHHAAVVGCSSTRSSPCTTRMSTMPSIAARAAACASPAAASRTIGISSISPSPSARPTQVSDVEMTSRAIRKTVTIHAPGRLHLQCDDDRADREHRRRRHLGEIARYSAALRPMLACPNRRSI